MRQNLLINVDMNKKIDNVTLKTNSEKNSNGRRGIQVIARAASILRSLEKQKEGLSLGQIAQRVDLPRSTVQRIVSALANESMVIAATLNARVKLGPAILRLAENTSFDFSAFVRPHLDILSRRTNETVDLSMNRGNQMVFVDQIQSNHRLSATSSVGESFLMYNSANGKAALSLMSDEEISALYSRGLHQGTDNTISDFGSLMKDVESIRSSHIAFDLEEHTEGICAVGTAFRDSDDRIFAVSVPVPAIRFVRKEAELVEALTVFRKALLEAL